MWTHSGVCLEKIGEKCMVYANDGAELDIFADEHGNLQQFFIEQIKDDLSEDGLYQAWIGYGPSGAQHPKIYKIRKIADLNWEMK